MHTHGIRIASRNLVRLAASLVSVLGACIQTITAQATGTHDPDHAAAAARWCATHVVQAQLNEALSDCNHALEQEPADVQSLSNRGSVHLMLRTPKSALQDFNRALALRPGDARLHCNRGIAHRSLGEHEVAIVDYSQALRLQPDNFATLTEISSSAWSKDWGRFINNRGYEFERIGNRERALDDYDAALAPRRAEVSSRPIAQPTLDGVNVITL